MLSIKNLSCSVEEKKVLNNISLNIEPGKNYCIVGKNGSGKSSLALTLLGHPNYQITGGDILVNHQSIKEMCPEERSQQGLFLAFQSIPEIKGVKLFEFLRTIYNTHHHVQTTFVSFKKIIEPLLIEMGIEKDFLWRDLNVGFSGGEKRKTEILQLRLLEPTYIFLDEVDSGLDIDAFKNVSSHLKSLNSQENSFVIITHYFHILEQINVDRVYVLDQGNLVREGGIELIETIKKHGFKGIE